jgi:hypothetical protein
LASAAIAGRRVIAENCRSSRNATTNQGSGSMPLSEFDAVALMRNLAARKLP